MKKTTTKIILLIILIGAIFFISPVNNVAMAQEADSGSNYEPYATGWEIIPYECIDPKGADRPCDLNSFIQLFINLSNIMLKLITPLAMIIIIFAGYQFITARGKQEQIQSGKRVLGGVFIGMVIIVFGGWVISYFIVQTLVVGGFGKDKNTKLFQSNEYKPWTQEWWSPNGSSNSNESVSSSGCCVLIKSGCKQTTDKSSCTKLNPAAHWTKNTKCEEQNICKQIKKDLNLGNPLYATIHCCTPTDTKKICYFPTLPTACLSYPDTETNINICQNMPNICETIN